MDVSTRVNPKGSVDEPRRKDFSLVVEERGERDYLHAAPCARTWKQRLALRSRTNPPHPSLRLCSSCSSAHRPLFFPLAAATGPYIDPNDVTWLAVLRSPTWPTKGPQPGLCAPGALFLLPSILVILLRGERWAISRDLWILFLVAPFFFFFGYFDRWNLWLSKKSGGNSVKFCKEKPSIDFFLHKKIISREKYEFVISSW